MLKIESGKLVAGKLILNFPAVRFSINGKIYEPDGEGTVVDKFTRLYQTGDVAVKVRVEEFAPNVWRKFVTLQSSVKLPTPDWVETDRQEVDDKDLRLHGYFATTLAKGRVGAEDAGGSLMPGCGYPLIGKNFFAGIEHPAAFAKLEEENKSNTEYYLRQHPVWNDANTIELAAAVFSMSSDAEKTFRDYLDMVRRAPQEKPFFSLCSFWSDPYLGNFEYLIAPDNYCSFV